MGEEPTARRKHPELTPDQLAELQPGLAELMPQVGDRYWIAYYAAKGGNWALAAYQLRHLSQLLRKGAITRPKHAANLIEYEQTSIGPLMQAIKARDFLAFERAYQAGIALANQLHRDLGHPDIVWRLPDRPPDQFDLGPQPEPPPKAR
ncbi:MAG TPA: hypothetical protein VET65_14425 [Candidatus Limnocylindrales bacterium]|nr:hypothetical protein [Candidatus Limnocylindrales bacterium]